MTRRTTVHAAPRPIVVYSAGTPWDGFQGTDQHVAGRLSRYADVLYVDPPVSLLSGLRHPDITAPMKGPRLRKIGPDLWRLTPLVLPGLSRPGMRHVTELLLRRHVVQAVRELGGHVAGVIAASQNVVLDLFPGTPAVFLATDDLVAGADLVGVPARWLRRCERRLVNASDTVVAISPVLAERLQERGARRVAVIPNGVDHEVFQQVATAAPPPDVDLPSPVAGFVGHLSERIDLSLLEAVAARGISLLLVGPRQLTFQMSKMNALLELPNVRWVGRKPFEQLPSYLARIDVGLVPYADTAFNRASFPLKTLEYLAAGRGVVATDLPSIRWIDSPLVEVATGAEEFASAVARAALLPHTPDLVARRQALAAEHSWDRRTAEIAALLELHGPHGESTLTRSQRN